eukprot:1533412-Prymnesium_polylepis.1
MQRVTSSLLVVMLARTQSLGMLCLWGGIPRGRSECAVASRTHPPLPHVTSRLVSSAPQVALPG